MSEISRSHCWVLFLFAVWPRKNSLWLAKQHREFLVQLSEKAIKEFKEIWFAEYSEKISDEEAKERGLRLLALFKILSQPSNSKDNDA